jgi:hypothetical protein
MPIPSTPFARYRASSLTAGAVSSWEDEGSGGNDLAQANGSLQPTCEAAGFNGNKSVLFDTADYMNTGSFAGGNEDQPNTIVFMGEMVSVSASASEYLCDGLNGGGRHAIISSGDLSGDPVSVYAGQSPLGVTSSLSLVGTADDDFCLVAIFDEASSELHYNDGGNTLPASTVGAHSLDGLTVGARINGANGGNFRVVEILVYDRVLSGTDITDLQDYFEATYTGGGGGASGGSEATVTITAEGAGAKHAYGGSEATVTITAEGAGAKHAYGGSEATVTITAEGDTTTAEGGLILLDVMAQIGARLGTITGLRVYDYPADHITPPAAVIAYPDEITFDETYGRGMDRMTLPVLVIEGRASDRASRNNLVPYANGAGAKSIKAVVESGTYTAFDAVRVTRCEFDVVRITGVDYAVALFDLDIGGSGE